MKIVKKHKIIFVIVLTFFLIGAGIFINIDYHITWERWNGAFVDYDGTGVASNGTYIGIIEEENHRVVISDQSGEEVSYISDSYSGQIALGKDHYYLLFPWENEEGDAKVIQYDYQSVKIREYTAANTAMIACKDGYLFMGDWLEEEDDGEEEDGKYALSSAYDGFYANQYIAEERFGEQPERLTADQNGVCIVGNTEFYEREEGYFYTEPLLKDYPGVSMDDFRKSDKKGGYDAETQQESENRKLLVKEIGIVKNVQDPIYKIYEYQMGDSVYGVCNVFDESVSVLPIEPKDVICSYFYKIDPYENKITILAEKKSCYGLMLSDRVVIYQDNDRIVRCDLGTNETKEIYKVQNRHRLRISIGDDYLLVGEDRNHKSYRLFFSDESYDYQYTLVKWN